LNERSQKTFDLGEQTNENAAPKIGQRRLLFQPTCIQAIASRGSNNLLRQIINQPEKPQLFGMWAGSTNGMSVDIATNRCIAHLTRILAMPTMRSHLANIYAKTGTAGQSDVIRLAAQLVSPARPAPDVR
jgi:hypothetical protein